MNKFKRVFGFSLLEMAVVIVIGSMLVAGGLVIFNNKIENDKYAETLKRMAVIEKATIAYLRLNTHIPCPAYSSQDYQAGYSNWGVAAFSSTPYYCDGDGWYWNGTVPYLELGLVPVRTLGIDDMYAFDAWGNKFTFGMIEHCSGARTSYSTETIGDATYGGARYGSGTDFSSDYCGGYSGMYMTIVDSRATNNVIASNVVLVIMSHGPNGHGAYNEIGARLVDNELGATIGTDEINNGQIDSSGNVVQNEAVFVSKPRNLSKTSAYFDDIVWYYTKDDLVAKAKFYKYNPKSQTDSTFYSPVCEYAQKVQTKGSSNICSSSNSTCTTVLNFLSIGALNLCQ